MKSMLFKTLTIIMGMVMSFSLVSCGDDDKDEPEPTKTIVSATANYLALVGTGYQAIYDVTVTYTDANGVENTAQIGKGFEKEVTIPADKLPSDIVLKVEGKVKSTLPEIPDDKIYTHDEFGSLIVTIKYSDGTTETMNGNLKKETGSSDGAHFKAYAANPDHATKTFYSQSVKVK